MHRCLAAFYQTSVSVTLAASFGAAQAAPCGDDHAHLASDRVASKGRHIDIETAVVEIAQRLVEQENLWLEHERVRAGRCPALLGLAATRRQRDMSVRAMRWIGGSRVRHVVDPTKKVRPQRVTLWPRLISCMQMSSGATWGRQTFSPAYVWPGTMRPQRVAGGVNRVGATSTSHHLPIFPSSHFIERLPCSKFVSAH
jgi:hypothetical protein